MRLSSRLISGLLAVFLPFCAFGAQQAATAEKRSVILILLDGFRADMVEPDVTPVLHRLAEQGARGSMIPVWPPISTPNHWAIVTGLNAKHSGLFHNELLNPATGAPVRVTEPGWADGEPIWAAVVRHGGISGVLGFWMGVQVPELSMRPSFHIPTPFGPGLGWSAKLAVELLDQPPATRPDLLTLYTSSLDHAQHLHGVRSAEALAARREIDRLVGTLVQRLAERKMEDRVDLVIVADHGALDTPNVVRYEELADPSQLMTPPLGGGPVVSLWPKPGMEDAVYDQVKKKFPHLRPMRPREIPASLECCDPGRVPPILVLAEPGWQMLPGTGPGATATAATHGFDNSLPDMLALFVAKGPSFRAGVQLGKFRTVDVYSLLAELLRVRPKSSDGSIDSLCTALKNSGQACTGRN